ncbi:VOC family protein [Dongia deserti]|uniref:VOC family protein n=1 Tax=Dongia deserti TaxID=2268030 RepID=UPI002546C456|nr:VOC family protein [Dongia deserti]
MQAIVPYLTVSNASEAIDFYKKAFDAKENSRMPEENGKRIMHADLTIHGGTIFVMDEFPEYGSAKHPNAERKSPVGIVIQLSTPKDVDAVYAQAVAAGAKSTQEPADMFWGARYAAMLDPFGHEWMLNSALEKK